MNGFQAPWRTFRHPDGRTWEARVEGTSVRLRISLDGRERVERCRAFGDGAAAARQFATLVDEQIADGFAEVSPPVWRAFLDQLVEHWQQDDPTFDAASLRDRTLATTSPAASAIVEHVLALADRWVAQPDGSLTLDMDYALDRQHVRWLEHHGIASLPALLLALRHHDNTAQLAVEAIVGGLRTPDALPALMSVLEHPSPNLAFHLGGRPQHIPTWALLQLGAPDPDTAARLIRALDHEDFRIAGAAAAVLCEFSIEDRLFAPLFAREDRAKREDPYAWSLVRAAEVRRDPVLRPFLQWMQRSSRFAGSGCTERIEAAIAGLRERP